MDKKNEADVCLTSASVYVSINALSQITEQCQVKRSLVPMQSGKKKFGKLVNFIYLFILQMWIYKQKHNMEKCF